jgi:hypothetical protein
MVPSQVRHASMSTPRLTYALLARARAESPRLGAGASDLQPPAAPPVADPPPGAAPDAIKVPRAAHPSNEFGDTEGIFLRAFPHLFPLGRGMVRNRATLTTQQSRFFELHFSRRFATCHRFKYTIFNAQQRHRVCSETALRAKTNKGAMKILLDLTTPEGMERVKRANENKESPEARGLLREVESVLAIGGGKVPFSLGARRAALGELHGYNNFYGPPSAFLTFSPVDHNEPLVVRLTKPSANNIVQQTLTSGESLLTMLEANGPEHFVELRPSERAAALARLPALVKGNGSSSGEAFRLLLNAFTTDLLGLPPSFALRANASGTSARPTLPDARPLGMLGTLTAFYLVVESQGRGSSHAHMLVWGGFAPNQVQAISENPDLRAKMQRALDSQFCTTLTMPHALDRLARDCSLVSLPPHERLAALCTPNPLLSPEEFHARVQALAASFQLHTCSSTCFKKDPLARCCRFAFIKDAVPHDLHVCVLCERLKPIADDKVRAARCVSRPLALTNRT